MATRESPVSTDQTTNLGLPFLMPSQAQKHVTVNESLLRLDALVQARVESRSAASQPGSPTDGRLWILPAGKTGPEWGGYANGALAYYRDGAWEPIAPQEGWRAWVADEGVFVRYTGLAWTADAAVGSLNAGPLAGFRNAVMNGDFRIWQRGTSFSPANADFVADRWNVRFNGSGATRTVSRQAFTPGQTDVPGEPEAFLRWAQSVAGSGATDNNLRQRVEDVRLFAGQTATLSFYAKADASGTLGLRAFQNFGSGGSSAVQASMSASSAALTTAWQRFTSAIAWPSISGKTIGTSHCLELLFDLPLNATFTIDFANVQLEPGPVATPVERRPLGLELMLCQRYFEKSFAPGTAPAQNVGANTGEHVWAAPVAGANTQRGPRVPFKVSKRATPTVTLYNPQAANAEVRDHTAGQDCSGAIVASEPGAGEGGFILACTGHASTAAGDRLGVHWTASAEL
jgi:hypothetical protein